MPILNLGENKLLFFIVIGKNVNQKRKWVMGDCPLPISFFFT